LLREIDPASHPGLRLRPVRFVPTFDKWRGQSCGGITLHVVDAREVRSVRTTLAVLAAVQRLWPDDFQWLPPPYEYETEKPPIDILFGSTRLRESSPQASEALAETDVDAWRSASGPFQLYP
jgi:uncharacterized protein YbbC (DUF1343 family)